MKFYSELTNEYFDNAEDCLAVEKAHLEAEEAKKMKQLEKEARKEEIREAFRHYNTLRESFYEDYNEKMYIFENGEEALFPLNVFLKKYF